MHEHYHLRTCKEKCSNTIYFSHIRCNNLRVLADRLHPAELAVCMNSTDKRLPGFIHYWQINLFIKQTGIHSVSQCIAEEC